LGQDRAEGPAEHEGVSVDVHEFVPAGQRPTVVGGPTVADEVIGRMTRRALAACERQKRPLVELLYETIYREQQRLASSGPDPRSEQDAQFVNTLRRELAHADASKHAALLHTVLTHYTAEICGHFDRHVYTFATGVLPSALGLLLHGRRPLSHLFEVDDRVLLEGDVEGLRRAAQRGPVVLVPTHVSHLDSLLLGYAIFRLGLPPFAYGAGLNLFSNPVTGFFMRNLGAFTVDRKKVDPLYLETVKEYATVLLEHGQHMLFFPGGTRSRSGALEDRLKLGFLGKVVTAFGNRRASDPDSPPIAVVPCTLSYPLVLEAASLIDDYLRAEGGAQFVEVHDEFERPASWLGFMRGLAELDVQVHVRFGSPLDPFGNSVDRDGMSRDRAGRALDPTGYVRVDGAVRSDEARDAEYTKMLATSVLASFRRASVALPSSVLAFALFACLRRSFPRLGLFRLLRVLGPHTAVPMLQLEPELDAVLEALRKVALRGDIALAPELEHGDRTTVIERGLATLSTYHRVPVLRRREHDIEVTSPVLLFYYQNRLQGFGLPGSHQHNGPMDVAPDDAFPTGSAP